MHIDCYGYSDIGGREENEDTIKVCDYGKIVVAILADGLGGQGDGKAASTSVCESLIHCGEDGLLPSKEDVAHAFEQANLDLISKQRNQFHMKTTAVYLCLQDDLAIWGHIGDSRLYHLYQGKICDYTLDHSASQLAVFLGDITREQIPGDAGRSRLVRAMGVAGDTPEIHATIRLERGRHIFLLCSDGLWEYLRDKDIEDAARKAKTAKAYLNILRSVKKKKSPRDCDNNSAIVLMKEV